MKCVICSKKSDNVTCSSCNSKRDIDLCGLSGPCRRKILFLLYGEMSSIGKKNNVINSKHLIGIYKNRKMAEDEKLKLDNETNYINCYDKYKIEEKELIE